jgi:predicted phosphate transport protein (TIGR00153 family)
MGKIHSLLIAHSQKVSLCVHVLKSAAEAWQRGDREELERFVNEASSLEQEADSLRRQVAREISRSQISFNKKELFRRLVHQTDDIADTARHAGRFMLIIRDLLIPPELKGDIVKMASLGQAAMSRLAEAIYCLSEPPERRVEHIAHISEMEESVDELEFKVHQEAANLNVDTWSAIMFWRLVLTVGRISDYIEDAADELLAYEGDL